MPIDFEAIFADLFEKGIIIAAVVTRRNGEIVHTSSNWAVDPTDIKRCLDSWLKKSQFLKLQEVKYSLLLNTEDYFSGVNYKERSFLMGASSPEEDGQRYYVLGYAPPGASGRNAYVDLVRAANMMKESTSYMEEGSTLGGKYDSSEVAEGGGSTDASPLQEEVNQFLEWIRNAEGLAAYIRYYLDQDDPNAIAQIAKAYKEFGQIFGF